MKTSSPFQSLRTLALAAVCVLILATALPLSKSNAFGNLFPKEAPVTTWGNNNFWPVSDSAPIDGITESSSNPGAHTVPHPLVSASTDEADSPERATMPRPQRAATRAPLYSLSGRVLDLNNQPVANVGILINGNQGAITDGNGNYTIANVAEGTHTVVPSKPGYSFSPGNRKVSVTGKTAEQNFSVLPDLGFRPNRDGFKFANPGQATPDCESFRNSFSGLDIQCHEGRPQDKYADLFERYKFSFATGVCTGMSAASLAYFTGQEARPRPVATIALTSAEAWSSITRLHGRQYTKSVLDLRIQALSAWTNDTATISKRVDEIYQQLRQSVQPGNRNPIVLDLLGRNGCSAPGHTVTPYRLDVNDPLRPKAYIYENYFPSDTGRYIQFDLASAVHSFSYWKWDSNECGALVSVPLYAFLGPEDKTPSAYLPNLFFPR